jgi:dolichol-phosphate mannosyltransferase
MVLDNVAPKTIINCLSHGAYPFQKDELNIFEMNFGVIPTLMSYCEYARAKLIHAGTSSEYGSNSAGPKENYVGIVDDMYAITKQNATKYIRFAGKNVYSCSLRLYSVYGPWEDSSRLIPQIIQFGLRQEIPPLAFPSISRDFIYVEDVVEAFVHASIYLEEKDYGGVFNIGTGLKTTLAEIGLLAYDKFRSASRPVYNSMPPRDWDHCNDWYADPAKAGERLNWKFKTPLAAGIDKTVEWYRLRLSNGKNWPSLRDCNSPKERGVI